MPHDNSLLERTESIPSITANSAREFDVFISYSRKDKDFCSLLERSLRAYTPPRGLDRARRLSVFCDTSDLVGADYFVSIDRYLRSARKLIIICSPHARMSDYVNDEICRFVDEARGADNIIPIIIAGLPNNEAKPKDEEAMAFPDALCSALKMPLAIDYRGFDIKKHKLNRGTYARSWYTLIASILGRSREEIEERERKRAARARRITTAITSSVIAVLVVFLGIAISQWWVAKTRTITADIEASDASFVGGDYWNALKEGLQAAQIFRALPFAERTRPTIRQELSQSVQQALYGIKEFKRLNLSSINGPNDGYERKDYVDRQSSIGQLQWSPNGKSLAFLSGHDQVAVWGPDSNSLVTIHPPLNAEASDGVRTVSWRPPGDDELTISSKNGTVEFFNRKGNQSSPSIRPISGKDYDFYGISWRPDGQELAFATFTHGLVVSRPDGIQLRVLKQDGTWTADSSNHWRRVWSVSWSHEPGHLLAAAGLDGTVRLVKSDDGSLACKARVAARSMSWSPDGKSLAVGLDNGTVQLVSEDCTLGPPLMGHTARVTGVSWSSQGRLAAASDEDDTVSLWENEAPLDTFHTPTVWGGVQWRPDGRVLATLYQNQVRLWRDNPLVKTFAIPADGPAQTAIADAALSPDGGILAAASANGRLYLWRKDRDNTWPSQPELLTNSAVRVSWSPDGQRLAFTSDYALTICDRSGKIIWQSDGSRKPLPDGTGFYTPFRNRIRTVIWSPDGTKIATGDGSSDLTIWDAKTGLILAHAFYCDDWINTLAWNPVNDRSLAVGCHNKGGAHLLQWNPDKKDVEETKSLNHGQTSVEGVTGVSWSNDGQILATAGNDTIDMWKPNGTLIRSIHTGDSVGEEAGKEIGKVAWNPDGTVLAVASGIDVELWGRDRHLIAVLKGHHRIVESVMWNKQTLVSASDDGTVRLWEIDKRFVDDPLGTSLVESCKWLQSYLEGNPLISKEDRDLQSFCKQF